MKSAFLFVGSLLMVGSVLTATGCGDETGSGGEGGSTASSTTGGDGGAGGTGAGTGGAGGGAAAELTCAYYCNAIDGAMGACKGDTDDQYADNLSTSMKNDCMAVCATFTEGKLGETSGNTLGCRIYHAGVAGTDAMSAATHCPHAGPFGDDTCGERCDVFCSMAEEVCTGAMAAWADKATCMTDCAKFAKDPKYSVTNTSGDNFGCRAYHLTAAAVDPATHCAHIKTMSDTCM